MHSLFRLNLSCISERGLANVKLTGRCITQAHGCKTEAQSDMNAEACCHTLTLAPASAELSMMSGKSSSPVMHDACEDLGQNYLKADIIQSLALLSICRRVEHAA